MKQLRFVAPIALLVLAGACNSDDGNDDAGEPGDAGGSELTEDQQTAADQLLAIGEDEGLPFDVDCVEQQAAKLSDEDAAAIVAAGPDGDVELSADGDAVTRGLYDCIDNELLVDRFIDEMQTSGADVDEQCMRDALEGVNLAAMFAESDGGGETETDPATAAAVLTAMDCIGGLGDPGDLGDPGG